MATKIVLNKKNAKDEYRILSVQFLNGNGKMEKKSNEFKCLPLRGEKSVEHIKENQKGTLLSF